MQDGIKEEGEPKSILVFINQQEINSSIDKHSHRLFVLNTFSN